jgi:ribosome-binding ATPase YchF (GTP1/OBG family)
MVSLILFQIPRLAFEFSTSSSVVHQAAGTIHGDFERGFICAEVMTYADLKELGTEAAVKAAGKYRQQGKEYVVQVRGLGCHWMITSP